MIDLLLRIFYKPDPCTDLLDSLIEGDADQIAAMIERPDISADDLDWVCSFMAGTLFIDEVG